jgi:hypothetical protein
MDDRRVDSGLLASGRRHLAICKELIETSAELIAQVAPLRVSVEAGRIAVQVIAHGGVSNLLIDEATAAVLDVP